MKKLLMTLVACLVAIAANAWSVSFTNPDGWASVSVYTFDPELCGGWPGAAMTKSGDVWTYTGTGTPKAETKIIFNDGKQNNALQTGNLDFVDGGKYNKVGLEGAKTYEYTVYFDNTNNWSNVYVYGFGSMGFTAGYPGDKLTKGANGLYAWTITTTSDTPPVIGDGDGFLFGNNNDQQKTPDIKVYTPGATYLPNGQIKGEPVTLSLYVIGANVDGQEWALGTNKMTDKGNGVYEWSGNTLGNEFKINDGTWDATYNIGMGDDGNIKIGTPYHYYMGDGSGNIEFDGFTTVTDPKIVLDMNAGTITLTGTADTGGEVTPPTPTIPDVMYLKGTINDWEGVQMTKEAELSENGETVYTVTLDKLSGTFKFCETPGESTWSGVNIGGSKDRTGYTFTNNNTTLEGWLDSDEDFAMAAEQSNVTVTLYYQPDESWTSDDNYKCSWVKVSWEDGTDTPETDWYFYKEGAWFEGQKMTNKGVNDGNSSETVYEIALDEISAGLQFKLFNTATRADGDGNPGLGAGNSNTFNLPGADEDGSVTLEANPGGGNFYNGKNAVKNATLTLYYNPNGQSWLKMEGTVEVAPSYPENVYLISVLEGETWNLDDGVEATGEDGVYKFTDVKINDLGNGSGYFQFSTVKGENWEAINGSDRYGAATKDSPIELVDGTATADDVTLYKEGVNASDSKSWMIAAGTYNMTLDLSSMTLTVTQEAQEETPATWSVMLAAADTEMTLEGTTATVTATLNDPVPFYFIKKEGETSTKYGPKTPATNATETHIASIDPETSYELAANDYTFVFSSAAVPNKTETKVTFTLDTEALTFTMAKEATPTTGYIDSEITPVIEPAQGTVSTNDIYSINIEWPGVTLDLPNSEIGAENTLSTDLVTVYVNDQINTTWKEGGKVTATNVLTSDEQNPDAGIATLAESGMSGKLTIELGSAAYSMAGKVEVKIAEDAVKTADGLVNEARTLTYNVLASANSPTWNPDQEANLTQGSEAIATATWTEGNVTAINNLSRNSWIEDAENNQTDAFSMMSIVDGKLQVDFSSLTPGNYTFILAPGQVTIGETYLNGEAYYTFSIVASDEPATAGYVKADDAQINLVLKNITTWAHTETLEIPVKLYTENEFNYDGFQFTVELPEGFVLNVDDCEVNSEFTGSNLVINEENGKMLVYGEEFLAVSKDEQLLVTLNVSKTYDTKPAVTSPTTNFYTVNISDVTFSEANEGSYDMDLDLQGKSSTITEIITPDAIPATAIAIESSELAAPSWNKLEAYNEGNFVPYITQGQSVIFHYTVTPANTTSEIEWTADGDPDGVTFDDVYSNGIGTVTVITTGDTPAAALKITGTAINGIEGVADPDDSKTVEVQAIMLADANDNDKVTVSDVADIANYMTYKANSNATVFDYPNANAVPAANGAEEVIDDADLQYAINKVLGITPAAPSRRMARTMTNDKLVADNYKVMGSEPVAIGVNLDNSYRYTTLQAIVSLPEGMQLVDVTKGARAAGHELQYSVRWDGKIVVLLYSMKSEAFAEGEGALFNLNVKGNEESGSLYIYQIKATDRNTNSYGLRFEGGKNVTDTTGVDGIDAAEEGVRYFTVDGVEIVNPQPGQIVIRMANGKAEKVVVK